MELIRKLLFYFEESITTEHDNLPKIEGYDADLIKYQIYLLHNSNLLNCEVLKSKTTGQVIYLVPLNLSWKGSEFLEKVRSDTVWRKIKQAINSKGVAFSFSIIDQLASQYAEQKSFIIDPDLDLKWQTLIEKTPDDLQLHALHALRLGLYLKVERDDVTEDQATEIFENMRTSLIESKERQK